GKSAGDDRLNAGARHLVGEFECTEEIVRVGESKRGLAVGFGKLRKPGNGQCPLKQRVGRMHVQMDKTRHEALSDSQVPATVGGAIGAVHRRAAAGRRHPPYPQLMEKADVDRSRTHGTLPRPADYPRCYPQAAQPTVTATSS